MKIEEIMRILPHRYPFLLIDKIVNMDPAKPESFVGRKCEAIKNVTFNENFFTGHFPERPIMPGVLIIEAMAQASAICGYRPELNDGLSQEVFIVAIDNARFRKPVVPGDQLKLSVTCTKDRQTILAFHCEATVDGERVAEADILAKAFPRKGKK